MDAVSEGQVRRRLFEDIGVGQVLRPGDMAMVSRIVPDQGELVEVQRLD